MRRSRMAALAVTVFTATCLSVAASPVASAASKAGQSVAPPGRSGITEHYQGRTFPFNRDTWGGAKDCAVMDASNVYCFATEREFSDFTNSHSTGTTAADTASSMALTTTGTCNGWAKIWDGANYTNRGLAFHDYGFSQYLGDYAPVPFNVRSWFTNGQRGYTAMTNCWGWTLNQAQTSALVVLHTNAQALSITPAGSYYIELFSGTG
jgi:hypothetical protein